MMSSSVAPTPPMGWNSYGCYGVTVREEEVRANADFLAAHLVRFGWTTIVIDGEWAEPEPLSTGQHSEPTRRLAIDAYGRLLPALTRFPSAANGQGFKPLAEYIHSLGLKFGIHVMRGIPVQAVEGNMPLLKSTQRASRIALPDRHCRWCPDRVGVDVSQPGGRAYYDSLIELYAEWDVDFIRADDFLSPYYAAEIEALSSAIRRIKPDIVLSLSPGSKLHESPEQAEHVKKHAQMWRITEDLWDRWPQVKNAFAACALWAPHAAPGNWPDADMLPLGRIGIRVMEGPDRASYLTYDEQFTLVSLWCMARSPLMFGGDLPSMDEWTFSLLTNDEVLAINQHSANNHEICRDETEAIWMAAVPGSRDRYLGLFNIGDDPADIRVIFADLGLSPVCVARDVWERRNLGIFEREIMLPVNPHGVALLRLTPSHSDPNDFYQR